MLRRVSPQRVIQIAREVMDEAYTQSGDAVKILQARHGPIDLERLAAWELRITSSHFKVFAGYLYIMVLLYFYEKVNINIIVGCSAAANCISRWHGCWLLW